MKLGLAISNYNNLDRVESLLGCIDKVTHNNIEVYLLDNGCESEHLSNRELVKYDSSIVYTKSDEKLSFAGSENLLIRLAISAKCDWVWLLDCERSIIGPREIDVIVKKTDSKLDLLGIAAGTKGAGWLDMWKRFLMGYVVGACGGSFYINRELIDCREVVINLKNEVVFWFDEMLYTELEIFDLILHHAGEGNLIDQIKSKKIGKSVVEINRFKIYFFTRNLYMVGTKYVNFQRLKIWKILLDLILKISSILVLVGNMRDISQAISDGVGDGDKIWKLGTRFPNSTS